MKASFAETALKSLIVGARSFAGNPYHGDTLAEQLEQTATLTDTPVKTALVDLGYRGRPKRMSKAENGS